MKRKSVTARAPLTNEELEQLTAEQFLRLKLTEEEGDRLREINKIKRQERLRTAERIWAEEAPMVAELQAVGLQIQSIDDLVNRSERYELAIPILLKHLQMPYFDALKEAIARSLAVPEPEVRKAWPMLVDEYRKAPMGQGFKAKGDTKKFHLTAKHGIACTLSAAVTDETLPELIELAKDSSQGESRILLLRALKKRRKKNPLAAKAIEELASDPVLEKEIALWRK